MLCHKKLLEPLVIEVFCGISIRGRNTMPQTIAETLNNQLVLWQTRGGDCLSRRKRTVASHDATVLSYYLYRWAGACAARPYMPNIMLSLVAAQRQSRIAVNVFACFQLVEVLLNFSCNNAVEENQSNEVRSSHQCVEDVSDCPYL